MLMSTVFISFPMRGKTKEEIIQTFNNYKRYLTGLGYEVENSIITPDTNVEESVNSIDIYYLGRSIEILSRCTDVYFAKGWEHSRGCIIEHSVAVQYGLNCLYE